MSRSFRYAASMLITAMMAVSIPAFASGPQPDPANATFDVELDGSGPVPCWHGHAAVRLARTDLCPVSPTDAAHTETSHLRGSMNAARDGNHPFATLPVAKPAAAFTYRILVASDLQFESRQFAAGVNRILADPNGWSATDVRFVPAGAKADITIILAPPKAIDRLCRPLQTFGELSCSIRRRAIINAKRWREGAKTWASDVRGYRRYLINHEVGHVLGFGHRKCPGPGAAAPIMLQQSISLETCAPNGAVTPAELAILAGRLPWLRRNFARAGIKRRYVSRHRSRRRRYRRHRARSRINRRVRAHRRAARKRRKSHRRR